MSNKVKRKWPGEKPDNLAAMLRVDHAGEYGAVRIYEGQKKVLGESEPLIPQMLAHEQEHLDQFNKILAERRIRPTALMPLWHMAGYALGYVSAKISPQHAFAVTVAVEEVIDRHYAAQIDELPAGEKKLAAQIEQFRQDECHHHDIALDQGATQAAAYPLIKRFVQAGSRLAIALAECF